MSDQIVLDVLFGLIVTLFAAIGFWRGVAKEIVVTAGIFVGAEFADRWAEPWGKDLQDLIDMRLEIAMLVVAATALLAATILLGYGGSAVIGVAPVSLTGRLTGAALSAINGGLLLHHGLSFIESYLTDEGAQRVLDESDVSRLLLREFGLLLIGTASLAGTAVLVGLLLGRRSGNESPTPFSSNLGSPSYTDPNLRQRPVRLPRGADDGKYEPVYRGYDPERRRYAADAPRISETIPLPPVDPNAQVQDGFGGWERAAFSGDEWYRRAQAYSRPDAQPADGQPQRSFGQPTGSDTATDTSRRDGTWAEAESSEPGVNGHVAQTGAPADPLAASSSRQESDDAPGFSPHRLGARGRQPRHCRLCLATLGESDSFCPSCGALAR